MAKDFARFSLVTLVVALGLSAQTANTNSQKNEWSALLASSHRMHTSMASVSKSSDNDANFVRLMLPHHQAAIDMARAQLLYGKDPQVRRLAQEIITDQQSEVELMQLWLKKHQQDFLPSRSRSN